MRGKMRGQMRGGQLKMRRDISAATTDLEAHFATCSTLPLQAIWQRFGAPQNCLVAIADYLAEQEKTLLDILDCGAGERQPETFDVCDPRGYFQWFYHRHDESDQAENKSGGGHFHLFATPKFFADPLGVHHSHLIAIELDSYGDLGGFFVPNIWVTDEAPKPSELLKSACQKFDARQDSPSQLISIWLAALTRTFLGDIVNLLEQRDRFLSAMPRQARKAYFADPSISRICEWKLD